MKCPNCNREIARSFCIYCGYMDNGNFINKEVVVPKASDLELYLGKRFDIIIRNQNTFIVFLLGPLYFCFNKLVFLGVIFFWLDILYYIISYYITELLIPRLVFLSIPLSFLVVKLFYVTCANLIYIKICKLKIERIKKNNPNSYREILNEKAEEHFSMIQLIIGVLILLLIFAIILMFWPYK